MASAKDIEILLGLTEILEVQKELTEADKTVYNALERVINWTKDTFLEDYVSRSHGKFANGLKGQDAD